MIEPRVADTASVGRNVEFGENVTVGEGARIGNNVTLVRDVIVRRGATIGDNVLLGHRDSDGPLDLPVDTRMVIVGEHAKVRSGAVLYWGVAVGDRAAIGHNAVVREQTVIGNDTYIGSLAAVEGHTTIGDCVGIQTQCYITAYCRIGDYTFIGPSLVSTNDNRMQHRRAGHGRLLEGFTTGPFVRIAAGVRILPGIHFGEGCIVGVGSVVTKDVPPYKVVMGMPARVVRDAPRDDNPVIDGGRPS